MSNYQQQYFSNVIATLENIYQTQSNSIVEAAKIFAECVKQQGVIHGFGSGHSFAAAVELAGRAGGLVNTKAIDQFYGHMGWFDSLKGAGDTFVNLIDLQPADCFVMVSNSGNKPLHVELARNLKAKGIKIIVITSSDTDKPLTGMSQYADIIVNNCCPKGDCTVGVDNDRIMTGPVSSLSAAYIINSIVIECIDMLIAQGVEPPVMRSINQAGGKEYNESLLTQYRQRVFTI